MNMIEITLLFGLIAIPYVWLYSRNRDGGWHPYWGFKMRRKLPDGSWQFRKMTDRDADHDGDVADRSW